MLRAILFFILIFIPIWAPWMDSKGADKISKQVFDAFGPVPSACYDSEGKLLQDGVDVHWYPFGRMVHTCAGDYVAWMWGAVKEVGGVYKRAEDIQSIRSKPLTCKDVLERQEARLATSTDSKLEIYKGEYAKEPVFSIFEDAVEYKKVIMEALKHGPNFAGKFVVAEWGCGSGCQNHAIVDVETGLVVAYGLQTEFGVEYTLDSTVLVTNPISKLPELPNNSYDVESLALSMARVPREYYRLTDDALSDTQYLVKLCTENATLNYIEVEDDRLGVIEEED